MSPCCWRVPRIFHCPCSYSLTLLLLFSTHSLTHSRTHTSIFHLGSAIRTFTPSPYYSTTHSLPIAHCPLPAPAPAPACPSALPLTHSSYCSLTAQCAFFSTHSLPLLPFTPSLLLPAGWGALSEEVQEGAAEEEEGRVWAVASHQVMPLHYCPTAPLIQLLLYYSTTLLCRITSGFTKNQWSNFTTPSPSTLTCSCVLQESTVSTNPMLFFKKLR